MLTADYLDQIPQPIIDLFRAFEDSVILDIARRIAKMKFNSAAWQAQRLNESGMLYDAILEELAKLIGKTERELKQIFQQAGVKSMTFDDNLYKLVRLSPKPLNLSPAMSQVLAAGLQKTNGLLRNLTLTTAISGQNLFIDAADLAYMQIASGAFDYNSAIRNAVKELAGKGLQVITFQSGKRDHLDVAVRRAVLTGVNSTVGQLQTTRADEMGQDLVQTSAHIGARNIGEGPMNHESWQGKIFSRSGQSSQYPDFVATTGYGTGEGLLGWNCRHSFYPFFEGISQNAYDEATLDEYANKTVIYNGQEMSVYEATQKQRYIERQIRDWKRQAAALQAAGQDNTYERTKLGDWQSRMREFISQTGLDRQNTRENLPGLSRIYPVTRKTGGVTSTNSPVSDALMYSHRDATTPFADTLKIIDGVHGDGSLPKIPMRISNSNDYTGAFMPRPPLYIDIVKNGNASVHMTIAHEIGHFLDHSGIGTKGVMSSRKEKILSDWLDTVYRSDAFNKLEEIFESLKNGEVTYGRISPNHIYYLMQPEELWARSYAQYIAVKSQNPQMLWELDLLRTSNVILRQWSDNDFEPIMREIDKLFKDLGWVT